PDTRVFSHATLSPDVAHQVKPAGAALDMGLDDDGNKGIGVFIYRDAVGQGANDFKGVKLRWLNGSDQIDASTAVLSVHAIAMVYVPEGPFRSKSPFLFPEKYDGEAGKIYRCPLTTINTPDAAKPGGHANLSTNLMNASLYVTSDWPNGYGAFYCMKYSILQGEYARLLTEAAPDPGAATYNGEYGYQPHNAARRYSAGFYGLCGYTIRYSAGEMRYEADVPERPAKLLSEPDIHSFTAWAGLRPPTSLEYEKACRGPRAVARDEDAWAPGACAPAAGLAGAVPSLGLPPSATTSRLFWPGPSYWGIRDLSQSGSLIEWPAVVKECGRPYSGNHGTGSPTPPGGWVFTSHGEWYMQGMWQGYPLSEIGVWLLPEDFMRMPGDIGGYISTRCGRYGARAVRTASAKNDKDSPLQVEALPNLAGYDMAIVNLAGRFKNDGDKPLNVELGSAFPAVSFPLGAASRAITAAPKSIAPFKILTALTPQTLTEALRGSRKCPLRIQAPGGEMLAKQDIQSPIMASANSTPPVISSLEGGVLTLRITNATDRLCAVVVTLPPVPGVKLPETERRLDLAAGAGARVVFPVPRQGLPSDGVCQFPFRVAVAGGAPQSGTVAVELSNKTRWW
ncbi:MAG: SUMF1/EgtB/PvdO family nonheme iron enzyme, partial [Kiritimatiellia bacterium]